MKNEHSTLVSSGERILAACAALRLQIQTFQVETLLHYLDQLNRWNKTYNLTAVRDHESMLIQHIFDSLSIINPLQPALANPQSGHANVLDVGSGAGLPGIVIATMLPSVQVECVDAVEKKSSFIRQMTSVLKLSNLTATHARVEQLPQRNCAVVISRAFASIADFIRVAGLHVSPTGVLLAMKGQYPTEELREIEHVKDWVVTKFDELHVPELNAHRCMIWLNRNNQP